MTRVAGKLCVMLSLVAALLTAQERNVAFDVVSIRQNTSGGPGLGTVLGNTYQSTNTPVHVLIRQAYALAEHQLVGGPAWVQNERFDITAKASTESGEIRTDQMRAMVRTLLQDRFGLVLTKERRAGDVYVLKLARDDGRLGPDLHRVPDDCAARRIKDYVALARAMPRPANGASPSSFDFCVTMADVARRLAARLESTVTDQTSLSGRWDYVVADSGTRPGAVRSNGIPDERPGLFTAIEEQLGLKLERQQGFNEVWVITSVHQPTEN